MSSPAPLQLVTVEQYGSSRRQRALYGVSRQSAQSRVEHLLYSNSSPGSQLIGPTDRSCRHPPLLRSHLQMTGAISECVQQACRQLYASR